ncbi:MAG: response regulator transcription factor, partial [Myxococcota bacterium]
MRALICDDMQTERSNLQKILTGMGFVTESAADGSEAVEKAAANPPAVVFLDIVMPKMDGFATCRALKANE